MTSVKSHKGFWECKQSLNKRQTDICGIGLGIKQNLKLLPQNNAWDTHT